MLSFRGQSIYVSTFNGAASGNSTVAGYAAELRGSATQPFGASNLSVIGGGNTEYSQLFNGNTTAPETNAGYAHTTAGTFSNLCVRTTTTQPGTGSLVITLRKNAGDTALVVTVPAGGVAGMYCDFTNSVGIAVGDWGTYQLVNNAATNSAIPEGITMLLTPTAPATAVIPFPNTALTSFAAGADRFIAPYTGGVDTTDIAQWGPIPRAGTGSSFYCYVAAGFEAATNPTVMTVMVNGIASSMTATLGIGVAGVVAGSGSHVFSALDSVTVRGTVQPASTGARPSMCGFSFE